MLNITSYSFFAEDGKPISIGNTNTIPYCLFLIEDYIKMPRKTKLNAAMNARDIIYKAKTRQDKTRQRNCYK